MTNVECKGCGIAFRTVMGERAVEAIRRCAGCGAPALVVVRSADLHERRRMARRRAMACATRSLELRSRAADLCAATAALHERSAQRRAAGGGERRLQPGA